MISSLDNILTEKDEVNRKMPKFRGEINLYDVKKAFMVSEAQGILL